MVVFCLSLSSLAHAEEAAVFDMDDDAPTPLAATPSPTDPAARDLDSGTGTLAASLINDVLKKNQWAVQDCATRLGGAGFAGRMVVEWEILETGSVANVRTVETNLRNPPFEACIHAAVKRLRFAAPDGGTVITKYPFVFQQ